MSNLLSLKLDNWVYSRLAEPFPVEEVSFRVGVGSMVMAYLDARAIVSRLNSVVGAENWTDSYVPVSLQETLFKPLDENGKMVKKPLYKENYRQEIYKQTYDGMKCSLTVLGITKEDVGSMSYTDQLKGAASDALKRAAVKFGVGAYLYDLKNLRGHRIEDGIVVQPPELPDWALPHERPDPREALEKMIAQVRSLELPAEVRTTSEEVIGHLLVMGRYDPLAPVVVQRAVYEHLLELVGRYGA